MDEENKNFDATVPSQSQTAENGKTAQNNQNSRSDKANNLKDLAENTGITAYAFIGELKMKGHSSLGDLIFRDTMTMLCSASLASESIGKDKFTDFLEKGFYATGRLLVYLNFAGTLDVNDSVRQMLTDSVTGVHKIFAASIRTVRKSQTRPAGSTVI